MTDLSLAEKVEGLSGPNIGVDLRIISLFRPHPVRKDIAELSPRAILHYYKQVAGMDAMPRYTASLDVVVALIEKELPGWGYVLRRGRHETPRAWLIDNKECEFIGDTGGATPALALLAAFLRAKGEQNG